MSRAFFRDFAAVDPYIFRHMGKYSKKEVGSDGMRVIKGSYGGRHTAIGYLRLCRVIKKRERAAELSAQRERLYSALDRASEEIGLMRKNAEASVGEEHGEIFGVYLKILASEGLLNALCGQIEKGDSSEEAIRSISADGHLSVGGEFSLCQVREALEILLRVLEDVERPEVRTPKDESDGSYVYVSDGEGLLPILRDVSSGRLDKSRLSGAICLTASELTAAVSMDVPAMLIDEGELPEDEWDGVTAILDCRRKRLILDPDLAELDRYSESGRESDRKTQELAEKPSVTLSGKRIYLCGELTRSSDLSEHTLSGGDPKALVLTDGELDCGELSEIEGTQYALFKRLAGTDAGITVRLFGSLTCGLSVGGTGASLGLRGAGLFALFRQVYKAQIRAFLRATAEGGLSLLLPDVSGDGELWQFRSILREAKSELKSEGIPFGEPYGHGIELSSPAALLSAAALSDGASMIVVDLDRLVSLTSGAELFDPISEDQLRLGIPPALRLCTELIEGLRTGGRRFGIRGRLAADPELTHSIVSCGFDSIFLAADQVVAVKERILSFDGR